MSTPQVSGAPDTIYLVYGDLDRDDTHAVLVRGDDAVTWCEDKVFDSGVKYVRADLAAAPQPAGEREELTELQHLASNCPELNLSNYGRDEVEELNGWAIEVAQEIERLAASAQAAPAPQPEHDNLHDTIGQAIADKLTEWYSTENGTLGMDPFDSRNIDEIADAVIRVLPASWPQPEAAEPACDVCGGSGILAGDECGFCDGRNALATVLRETATPEQSSAVGAAAPQPAATIRNCRSVPAEAPPLPDPWAYCYEWHGPFGMRKFSVAPHNGKRPDNAVPLYTAEQMHKYASAIETEVLARAEAERDAALADAKRLREALARMFACSRPDIAGSPGSALEQARAALAAQEGAIK